MRHAAFIAWRDVRRQPCDQRVHVRVAAGQLVLEVLLGPAPDLSFEKITRPAKVAQAHRHGFNRVQRGDWI